MSAYYFALQLVGPDDTGSSCVVNGNPALVFAHLAVNECNSVI